MKNVIWYLLAGTRGGEMRARVLLSLHARPKNAHQLAQDLSVDYKTIQHHLRVLDENRAIMTVNKDKYGAVHFVSDELNAQWNDFESIWNQFGKTIKKHKQR